MSELWYVLIVLALVAIGGAVLWWRRTRSADRIRAGGTVSPPPRDYTVERETARAGGLSAEEQSWETDRLRRDQVAHEDPRPPERS